MHRRRSTPPISHRPMPRAMIVIAIALACLTPRFAFASMAGERWRGLVGEFADTVRMDAASIIGLTANPRARPRLTLPPPVRVGVSPPFHTQGKPTGPRVEMSHVCPDGEPSDHVVIGWPEILAITPDILLLSDMGVPPSSFARFVLAHEASHLLTMTAFRSLASHLSDGRPAVEWLSLHPSMASRLHPLVISAAMDIEPDVGACHAMALLYTGVPQDEHEEALADVEALAAMESTHGWSNPMREAILSWRRGGR